MQTNYWWGQMHCGPRKQNFGWARFTLQRPPCRQSPCGLKRVLTVTVMGWLMRSARYPSRFLQPQQLLLRHIRLLMASELWAPRSALVVGSFHPAITVRHLSFSSALWSRLALSSLFCRYRVVRKVKVKVKVWVLVIPLLKLRDSNSSALQSRKWQLIGIS